MTKVTGIDQTTALVALGLFAPFISCGAGCAPCDDRYRPGPLLVLGGLLVSALTLNEIGGAAGVAAGFKTLLERALPT